MLHTIIFEKYSYTSAGGVLFGRPNFYITGPFLPCLAVSVDFLSIFKLEKSADFESEFV